MKQSRTRTLTGAEAYAIMAALDLTVEEASYEFGVTERTIRRWQTTGATGASAAALVYARIIEKLAPGRWRRDATSTGKAARAKMSAAASEG